MTDTPNRSIGGLPARPHGQQPDLSRLQRRNRPTPTSTAAEEQATVTPLPRSVAAPASDVPVPAAAPAAPAEVKAQDRITVYLDRQLRERARTAFRTSAHIEGDRTWSDFIERAIRTEVERRERQHNDGKPYAASPDRLAPGRGIS